MIIYDLMGIVADLLGANNDTEAKWFEYIFEGLSGKWCCSNSNSNRCSSSSNTCRSTDKVV